ncbi:alpha/beta fold hydrolase [Nocardia sp. NPDC001965]
MSRQNIETGRPTPDTWYMAAGDGPPLVYLPGFGVHNKPLDGWERRASLHAVAGLTRHFRLHWINRREGLATGATVADLADDAAAAVRAGFAEPVDVLGYSLGGMIGAALAARHPALVRRLVVGGIAHRLSPGERAGCEAFVEHAQSGEPRAAMRSLVRSSYRNPVARAVLGTAAWLAGPGGSGRNWDPHDAVVTLRAIADADLGPLLPAIQAPTLVIAGERDFNCPPEYVREVVAAIPDARSATVPGKGHNATMTAPGFVEQVARFLLRDATH